MTPLDTNRNVTLAHARPHFKKVSGIIKSRYICSYINIRNNTKCRLTNPAKSELGLVSKKQLEKIITNVANTIKVNQWQNTTTVIHWFKSFPQKDKSRFIKFGIVEFYPSISEELLNPF